ncbi:MAG: (2Fe-2S)-binding protein [Deltaproteobacteria bacterium HGW-Deltaproteobacteria-24]|nr:MAG: (2Fe-2S)-binding protein [Deltaproteobacteria bacterium HGW-Deltaproteobacteria-24]
MSRRFEQTYEVCSCSHVTLGEIVYAICEKEAQTLQDIQNITDVGTHCRFCICQEGDLGKVKKELYCNDILKKFRTKIGKR